MFLFLFLQRTFLESRGESFFFSFVLQGFHSFYTGVETFKCQIRKIRQNFSHRHRDLLLLLLFLFFLSQLLFALLSVSQCLWSSLWERPDKESADSEAEELTWSSPAVHHADCSNEAVCSMNSSALGFCHESNTNVAFKNMIIDMDANTIREGEIL